jgi:uncharacterized membrane protein YwzB
MTQCQLFVISHSIVLAQAINNVIHFSLNGSQTLIKHVRQNANE